MNRFAWLVLLAVGLAACSGGAPKNAQGPPQRLVSLVPSVTELVVALGLSDRLVGVSAHDDLPELRDRARVADMSVDLEQVVALKPDLVLTDPNFLDPAKQLDGLGLPLFQISMAKVAEVPEAVRSLGRRLGAVERAESVAAEFEKQLADLVRTRDEAGQDLGVLILLWSDPPVVAGGSSYMGDILRLAGGKNVFEELLGYPTISEEQLAVRHIDLVVTNEELQLPEVLAGHRQLRLNSAAFSRPGLSSLAAVEAIRRHLRKGNS